jgi:hypothetical protein
MPRIAADCPSLLCAAAPPKEATVMTRMRHPSIVSFMGLCLMPPLIVTGACSSLLAVGRAVRACWLALLAALPAPRPWPCPHLAALPVAGNRANLTSLRL